MGQLIATTDPYMLIAVGFCLGVVTGIVAISLALKANGED